MEEQDATPDEAHELGWVAGHDFAINNLIRVFGDTDVGKAIVKYVNSEQYQQTPNDTQSQYA